MSDGAVDGTRDANMWPFLVLLMRPSLPVPATDPAFPSPLEVRKYLRYRKTKLIMATHKLRKTTQITLKLFFLDVSM